MHVFGPGAAVGVVGERVLVVAPHPDDETLGCGGTMCLHQRDGDVVDVVWLTSGERGLTGVSDEAARAIREAEAAEAGQTLGVSRIEFLRLPDLRLSTHLRSGARRLRKLLETHPPSIIYLPHPDESHPDHGATLPIVRTALALLAGAIELPELRLYEVWSPMTRYGWVEDISSVMRQKLHAVRCYRSQLAVLRFDRAVRGLNQYRGVLAAGSHYAEAFQYAEPLLPRRT